MPTIRITIAPATVTATLVIREAVATSPRTRGVSVSGHTQRAGSSASRELPRRFLKAFLLLCLRRDGNSYGYELYETVRFLGVATDLAAIYRAMRQMQHRGLVVSQWVPSDSGPDRRQYALTDEGRSAAYAAARELEMVRDGLGRALDSLAAADNWC